MRLRPQEPLFDADLETPTVPLPPGGLWNRIHTVAPLVLVGSKEPNGRYDIAPKHMAMPLGWGDWYCFVCTPRHATYANIEREGAFTVSFLTGSRSSGCARRDPPRARRQ
jgi:flavin reductase (DIM6/NTAB) family NADH-FMN oxidoreductase RutF